MLQRRCIDRYPRDLESQSLTPQGTGRCCSDAASVSAEAPALWSPRCFFLKHRGLPFCFNDFKCFVGKKFHSVAQAEWGAHFWLSTADVGDIRSRHRSAGFVHAGDYRGFVYAGDYRGPRFRRRTCPGCTERDPPPVPRC